MANRLDTALANLRRARTDVDAARAEFRTTLNAWAMDKTQANAEAHEQARERLNAAIGNLHRAEQQRIEARAEFFQMQGG